MPNEGGFAGHPKKRIRVFWGARSRPDKNHQRSAALRPRIGVGLAHMRLPSPHGTHKGEGNPPSLLCAHPSITRAYSHLAAPQIMLVDRQRADAFSGCCENRVA